MALRLRLLLIPLALATGLWASHTLRSQNFRVDTASFALGALAVLCLVGVAYGVWSARRMEARRKKKEDIFLNH